LYHYLTLYSLFDSLLFLGYLNTYHIMKNTNLERASQLATTALSNFANESFFWQGFEVAFGQGYDRVQATAVRQEAIAETLMLPIRVLDDAAMGVAVGAFAAATNTIYLQDSFVKTGSAAAISAAIIEELGHSIDSRVNKTETPGDEGAIFRLLVAGNSISADLLAELKSEDDWGTILVEGQELVVEMMVPTEGDDLLLGDAGDNIINALGGDDTIDSGLGHDVVDGGAGNDLLIIDYSSNTYNGTEPLSGLFVSIDDPIQSDNFFAYNSASGSFDQVYFSHIERFKVIGTAAGDNIYAGSGNDELSGGAGQDYINGGAGNDTIEGGTGNDELYADGGNDIINGGAGDDLAYGLAGEDEINGGAGNDTVSGGGDNDKVYGGAGNDDVYGGAANDLLDGGAGQDYIEGGEGNDTILGSNGNDTILGGSGNDYLHGGNGNNNLDGGTGDDILDESGAGTGLNALVGGSGSDTYGVYNSGTVITENVNEGNDSVWTMVNYTLAENVESLYLVGSITGIGNDGSNVISGYGFGDNSIFGLGGDDVLYGGEGSDYLNGGTGSDYLNGGTGSDVLDGSGGGASLDTFAGEAGNDTYGVYNSATIIIENAGEGNDSVWTAVNYTLAANVEHLYLVGDVTGIGNAENNTIFGFGTGNNIIDGGAGNDNLFGGAGSDTFILSKTSTDSIGDFAVGSDKLQISASTFGGGLVAGILSGGQLLSGSTVGAGSATNAAQRFLYNTTTGALYFDANGSAAGNGVQIATLATQPGISGNDFSIVL
jgi:Ca2+-binding RTX toxin-like protein